MLSKLRLGMHQHTATRSCKCRASRRRRRGADANSELKPSFWSKFPVNPLRVLGVIVVAVVYIAFPILIYKVKFQVRVLGLLRAWQPCTEEQIGLCTVQPQGMHPCRPDTYMANVPFSTHLCTGNCDPF